MNNLISIVSRAPSSLDSHSNGPLVQGESASLPSRNTPEAQSKAGLALVSIPSQNGANTVHELNGEATFGDIFNGSLEKKPSSSGLGTPELLLENTNSTKAGSTYSSADGEISDVVQKEPQAVLDSAVLFGHPSNIQTLPLSFGGQYPVKLTESTNSITASTTLETDLPKVPSDFVSPVPVSESSEGTVPLRALEQSITLKAEATDKPFKTGKAETTFTPSSLLNESATLQAPNNASTNVQTEIASSMRNPVDSPPSLMPTAKPDNSAAISEASTNSTETPQMQSQLRDATSVLRAMMPTSNETRVARPQVFANDGEVLRGVSASPKDRLASTGQDRSYSQALSTSNGGVSLQKDGFRVNHDVATFVKTVPQSAEPTPLPSEQQLTTQKLSSASDHQHIVAPSQPIQGNSTNVINVVPLTSESVSPNETAVKTASTPAATTLAQTTSTTSPPQVPNALIDTPYNMAAPLVEDFASDLSFTPDTMNLESSRVPLAQSQHQALATPPQLHPDLARSVAQQLASASIGEANRPLELALSPEELGRVKLTFSPTEGGMVVSVLAERPETLDLMRRNINSLAQEFLGMGYDQISFNFNQSGSEQQQNGQSSPDQPHVPPSEFQPIGTPESGPIAIDLTQSDRVDIRI
ncbi:MULTISPECIES: flagellar hook-length control protein FliK [Falsihalocynthiibacter]|uniref:flagellar hook-length control protein FliK n=1 Tax=Falsihalocynthiibacter TaxID=2854182 RepID=UPI0030018401